MRQQLVFTHPPSHLRGMVENLELKKKKKAVVQDTILVPTAEQTKQIRGLVEGLHAYELDILTYLLRKYEGDYNRLLDLFEEEEGGASLYFGSYSLRRDKADGKDILLLTKEGKVICSGGTCSIFLFVAKYLNNSLHHLTPMLRAVGYVESEGSFEDLLELHRLVRKMSPSLDLLTKIKQLKYLDEDSVVAKFLDAGADDCTVVHYGSGPFSAGSKLALEGNLICVDPRNHFLGCAPPHITAGFDYRVDCHPGDLVIVSDASVGDYGMVEPEGIDDFLQYCKTVVDGGGKAVVKLDINRYHDITGSVVSKVRPHNAEVIWDIGPGDRFAVVAHKLREEALAASRKRMEWFFDADTTSRVMTNFFSSEDFSRYAGKELLFGELDGAVKHAAENRWSRLERESVESVLSKRSERWERFIEVAGVPAEGEYARIHPRDIQLGPVKDSDPMVGTLVYSWRSLYHSAVAAKFAVEKVNGEWCVLSG